MSENGNDAGYGESPAETTSVFRADFLNELDNTSSAAPAAEQPVSGVEGLPAGAALLVVKRGPNAGSRFLLDQPTTPAAASSWTPTSSRPGGTRTVTSSSTT